MKYIVTTTIYSPSEAIWKFCNKPDWKFIIVGDVETPHDEFIALEKRFNNVHYLTPSYQAKKYGELSELIGWNTIDRRNIGFIEAYNEGAKIIASIDDDNIPYENWGKDVYVNTEIEIDLFSPAVNVFDPLSVTKHNQLWHRGFPVEYLQQKNEVQYKGKIRRVVLVQADLWDGNPDVDAIARMIFNPNVVFSDITKPYCSDKISPFNSQNIFLSRKIFPYYAVLPFVGRMDDIWASYIMQLYFPDSVIYCPASVFQDRNKQDLIINLRDELLGYDYTLKLIEDLPHYHSVLPEKTLQFYDLYQTYFK